MELKEILDILGNGFILLVAVGLIKAIYFLIRVSIQTHFNTKEIEEINKFIGRVK